MSDDAWRRQAARRGRGLRATAVRRRADHRGERPATSPSATPTRARCRTGPSRRRARCRASARRRRTPIRATSSTCGRRSPASRRCGATTTRAGPSTRRVRRPLRPCRRRPAADPYGGAKRGRDDTERDPSQPVRREPGRITIGTDPTDVAPDARCRRAAAVRTRRAAVAQALVRHRRAPGSRVGAPPSPGATCPRPSPSASPSPRCSSPPCCGAPQRPW